MYGLVWCAKAWWGWGRVFYACLRVDVARGEEGLSVECERADRRPLYDVCRFGLTYEASMTRLFRGGRTETIRSLSETSCNFVKTFEDSSVSVEERWAALQLAVTNHVVAAKDAMTGKGMDRHLFALYVVASGMGIESDFLKAAISQPWVLSTSQQPQRQVTKGWNPDDPAIEYRCGSALAGSCGVPAAQRRSYRSHRSIRFVLESLTPTSKRAVRLPC